MSSPVGACAPAGDPFLPAPGTPGCPVPPSAVKPLPFGCPPVARWTSSWPRLPARLPRLPGWPAQLLLLRPEGLRLRIRIILRPNPLPSRGLGWPPFRLRRHCWLLRPLGTFPRAPVGVRFPVRRTLCTRCFCRSRGIFGSHRVIHGESWLPTKLLRSSTSRMPFVHRLFTSVCVDVGRFPRLNGGVTSQTIATIIIIR